jgi:hypothetical protein
MTIRQVRADTLAEWRVSLRNATEIEPLLTTWRWYRSCNSAMRKGSSPMVMFLMALCLTVFGLAVSALAFGAATRDSPAEVEPRAEQSLPVVPSHFFVAHVPQVAAIPRVPLEVLLSQIERHVRLEYAAAESFIDFPSAESLHSRTMSPLVH